MKKMTSRATQAEKTKRKIYTVGINLLQKKGFDEVNVADIASKANVGIGTFYHYYDSKMDLFMDLYREGDRMFGEEVRKMVANKKTGEAIIVFFNEYCKLIENDGLGMIKKIYIPENHLFINNPRPMYDLLFEIVSKEKSMDNSKAKEYCDDLFLIARGVVFDWALHDGSYDLSEKMEKMISLCNYVK